MARVGGKLIWMAALAAAAASVAVPAEARERSGAPARLHETVQRAIHADGPLLEPQERALIERKCGYAPGSWDGKNFSMNDGVLHCSNGRRVDDPEVRAMMEVAGPRIGRRVRAAMAGREVRDAIAAVSEEATKKAMARLREKWGE